jgi:chemotaxis protein CheX
VFHKKNFGLCEGVALIQQGRDGASTRKRVTVNTDLEKILEAAAQNVFTTMLSFKVEFQKLDGEFFDGEVHVAGTVGLTGAFNGMIYLYSSALFARRMTCRLLSMTDSEIEGNEMVNDAIGELTNMMAGFIKSKLDNQGCRCVMTIPTVVRGRDFKIEPITGVARKTIYFQSDGGKVLVEALLKPTS